MPSSSSKRSFDSIDSLRDLYSLMESSTPTSQKFESELEDFEGAVEHSEDGIANWRSLFNFTTRHHVPNLLFAVFFSIISAFLKPTGAIFYGKIFTVLINFGTGILSPNEALRQISQWCIALVILGAISWPIEGAFLSLWITFGELQAKSIREKMFESMLEKGMDWYDLRQDGIASLMTRMQTQIRELQLSASQPMGFVIYEIGVSAAALGLGFYYAWQLTLVILATFPVLALVLFFVSKRLAPAIESQKRDLSVAAKQTNTSISNINTVKAYNGQDQEIWQYYNTIKRGAASYLIQARANALQFGVMKCATVGLFVQGFWFGLVLVNKGMDPGRVYTTYYACLIAMQSIEIVLPQWLVLSKGMSAGNTLKSMMSHVQKGQKVISTRGKVRPEVCEGDIEIKNVSFFYPANVHRNAITGVNFFFPAHETTFIVGKSGSGKSTIGNLLMKYYQIYRGEILIDGHSICTLDMNWVRQNITLVQQQSVLFNDTVLQNIAFGRRGPSTMKEIQQAVDIADLQQTLNDLPNGLETVVGLNGKSLSGGQQQRVAIARARLRNSPIVILDEATSALDQKSRLKVMQNIREWRKGKTTIIITHDISQILDEDYLYVLENGVVIEEGYRKVLEEKKHGAFASFLPVATTSTPVSPRRNSESLSAPTPSPLTGLLDADEFYPPHRYMSRIFGAYDSNTKQHSLNFGMQDGALSLGIGASRDNAMHAVEIWTTPEMGSDPIFEEFERSQRKDSPTRYLSLNTDPHSSFQPLPPARLNTNFDFSRDYGKRPLIPPKSPMRGSRSSLQPLRPAYSQAGSIPPIIKPRPATISKEREIAAAFSLSIDTSVKISRSSSPKELHKSETGFQELELEESKPLDPEPVSSSIHRRKAASMVQIFKTTWPMLTPKDRTILVFGFFAAFIVAVATPVFAYILAQLLAVYYAPSNRAAIAEKWAIILISVAVVDGIATFCAHISLEYAAQQWVNGLRVEALKRILAQPRSWFDKGRNSPDRISECLDRNAEEMRNLIGRFAGPIFITIWMLGISVVWALLIDYKLTLIAVACFPVVYLNTRIFDWITSRWETKCNEAADLASSIFNETFSNIRVVRALTLESHFKLKHDKAATAAYKTGIWRGLYSGLMFGMIDSLSYFIVATIFYYASVTDTAYEVTLLSVLKVINLLLFGIANAITLLNLVPQINSSRTTATQMLYLAQLPRRSSHETAGTKRIPSPFPVVFNNLSFAYPVRPKNKILKNINFTIEPGTCTALVGPSGSGKSTIASLLLSLYPPLESPHNHIPNCLAPLTFSGVPVVSLNSASLRNYISIVAQQPLLFPSTIYENITYGLPEGSPYLTLSAVKKAAEDAGIHDFIMSLQHGYSTPIGEGGMGISGGQAQRIAIARALIRKPKILILDEATSALDNVSADAIKNAIARIIERGRLIGTQGKGKGNKNEDAPAVLIITHDMEMMKVAERIIVLEKGEIKEIGGFNDLKRSGMAFRRLIGEIDVERVGDEEVDEVFLKSPVRARTKDTWVFEGERSGLRKGNI